MVKCVRCLDYTEYSPFKISFCSVDYDYEIPLFKIIRTIYFKISFDRAIPIIIPEYSDEAICEDSLRVKYLTREILQYINDERIMLLVYIKKNLTEFITVDVLIPIILNYLFAEYEINSVKSITSNKN